MYDKELTVDVLKQIQMAVLTILERFKPIKNVSDFTDSPQGMEKLDATCMLLMTIGESLKNLDKITDGTVLRKYTNIDWKKAKGLRDIISHHYFDINADAIYDVCNSKLKPLSDTIKIIIDDLS